MDLSEILSSRSFLWTTFCRKFPRNPDLLAGAAEGPHVACIKDPTDTAEQKRFDETRALFGTYGDKYQFDPMMIAAQGYQESALDQNRRSHVGAVGIMQVMPATGAEMKVGDIRVAKSNNHAARSTWTSS